MTPRRLPAVPLSEVERAELDRRVRARTSTQQEVLRAEIVLRAAAGRSNTAIAAALGIARGTARHWRTRFLAEGLAGLVDRPHCPPPRRDGPDIQAKIVLLACQAPAEVGWAGQTHWTIQDLATSIGAHPELGLGTPSKSTIHLLLQAHKGQLDRL
jgi:putative transposase